MIRRIFACCVLLWLSGKASAQADSAASINKLLELSLEELMDVKVVTASGYLQTVSNAPSNITVISAQQIAERGYEQLEDVLRDVPGIDMIHINGYAPTLIYFRGMYGAENLRALLMIDGIVENNILGSNDMAGPAYSLHNAERIEIIWGPASALYGTNAFGGVINIISKKGGDINGLKAEQGFGSFNTSFQKLSMGVKKSNFELALAGTRYSSDGPKFANRDPQYAGSYFANTYSFNGTITYHGKKSSTTLGYRTYSTGMGWGTYSNSPTVYLGLPAQGNNNAGTIGVIARDIRGEKSGLHRPFLRTLYLQNEYKPNDKFNLLSRLVYRETGSGDDSYIYVTSDGRKLIRALIGTFSSRVQGELAANFTPAPMHHFSAGLQYQQDNVEQGSRAATIDLNKVYLMDGRDTVLNIYSTFLPRKYDIRNNFGSYLQYMLSTSWLRKTDITLGLRYDRNSYFGDALSPRIAIVNQPAENLTFKLQFGKAFRAPTNLEIYQTPGRNFQLKQEKLKTYELNAIYAISKNLRVQVNGFHNELWDVIILGNLSGLNPDKNPGEIGITGIESALNMVLAKSITAFINFTYQDATTKNLITGNSVRTPGIARFKGNAGFTWHQDALFNLHLGGNWVGKRAVPRSNPYGPVGGYFLTNVNISTVPLFGQHVTASISIHNVFNVKWLDPGFRTADGLLYATVLEQPGINGLFKIGINL